MDTWTGPFDAGRTDDDPDAAFHVLDIFPVASKQAPGEIQLRLSRLSQKIYTNL